MLSIPCLFIASLLASSHLFHSFPPLWVTRCAPLLSPPPTHFFLGRFSLWNSFFFSASLTSFSYFFLLILSLCTTMSLFSTLFPCSLFVPGKLLLLAQRLSQMRGYHGSRWVPLFAKGLLPAMPPASTTLWVGISGLSRITTPPPPTDWVELSQELILAAS